MLQVLLNFSNCLSLVVTLTNLLILLLTKKYSLGQGRVHFYKIKLFIIITNKIKVIAQKMSKSKNSRKYEDKNKNFLT